MNTKLLIILFLLQGCGTLKSSIITSSLALGTAGAVGGMVFSPNEKAKDKNAFLFGVIGAVAGAGLAYIIYPKKKNLNKHMLLPDEQKQEETMPLFDFSPELKKLNPKIDFMPINKYEVPITKLPKALEGKVKKQYLIEYQGEAKTLKIGRRTFEISPFKAWEHVYE
jgi:hypothetical protein